MKCEKCRKEASKTYDYESYVYRIKYEKLCWSCYMKLMDEDMEWEEREDACGHSLCSRNGDY